MPDLPIDTLLIIGLVIASFVGKIFQKNQDQPSSANKPQGSPTTGDSKPKLGDILKEVWARANQSDEPIPEFSNSSKPPPISGELQEKVMEIKEETISPKTTIPLKSLVNKDTIYQNEEIEIHFGIKEELRSGPDSLKKAIVLKEILDKPLSLRTSPF